MKDIRPTSLAALRQHEKGRKPNVELGGYNMPPADQFAIYRVTFETADLERLCVINDFACHTVGQRGNLKRIQPTADFKDRVQQKLDENVDLRHNLGLAPVMICTDLASGSITVIDGNHGLTAHYLKYQTVSDVYAYVCVHPRTIEWGLLSPAARP